jgi:D-beta-D-heptose 7-phosphate kinase/D-beta-D-heptose 1-phosphate adenosyltransferase
VIHPTEEPRAAEKSLLSAERVRLLFELHPRILVVGDLILDGWFKGESDRMTREAPVPVVEVTERRFAAGGAANTALNLAALGAHVRLVGVLGVDHDGDVLQSILEEGGVDVSFLVRSSAVTTTAKTRILGGEHVIVRMDTATEDGYGREVLDEVATAISRARMAVHPSPGAAVDGAMRWAAAEIICDYGNGTLDGQVHSALAAERDQITLCAVDAHDVAAWADLRPDVVTPNAAETSALLGTPLKVHSNRAATVEARQDAILAASGAASAVVTLDRDGTVVLTRSEPPFRTRGQPTHERQASGAGDTFTAALVLALAGGWPLAPSALFAQAAANVVVRHEGTTICTIGELLDELVPESAGHTGQTLSQDELCARLDRARASGQRIVFTNGCFDLIHRGHTSYLRQARQLGDVLVVAVNSDESARRLKGPGRPINSVNDRAAVLVALSFVDYVTIFDEDTPISLIERVKPEVYAKGGDYSAEMLAETVAVERGGGQVKILDYVADHSTTDVVNKIRKPSASERGSL